MIQNLINRTLVASIPLLTGAKGKQRLSILIYHRVIPSPDYMREIDPTVEQFNWQMELLSRHFCPLSLSDACRLMDAGELPERAVCVTFDDGYADNAEFALPVLKKWQVPATVFVSTKYIDGGTMWNDTVIEAARNTKHRQIDLTPMGMGVFPLQSEDSRKQSAFNIIQKIKYLPLRERLRAVQLIEEQAEDLPKDLMLTTQQLKKLHANGIEIGGHTHSHPILSSLTDESARKEIGMGKKILEEIVGAPVFSFAYPNGIPGKDYLPVHQQMVVDAGFEAAVSTQWGVSNHLSNRWQLNRFTPWDRTPIKFLARLLLNQTKITT